MIIQISSLQNGRVKNTVKLNNRRHRDKQRLTIVEGEREVARALASGVIPHEAFICPQLLSDKGQTAVGRLQELAQSNRFPLYEVTWDVFQKIAYRGDSGGLLLVIPYLEQTLADLTSAAFVAVIENVEKPGNLGAILRTADAAGADAVILCGAGTDIHNPNAIRASLGALFTVPTVQAKTDAVISWLREQDFQAIAATPIGDIVYTDVDLTGKTAVVMGGEADGLSDEWLTAAHMHVVIPMRGIVDSLNLSVSTALLLYEVVRQRQLVIGQSLTDF